HWRMIDGADVESAPRADRFASRGALPVLDAQIAFCREAEELGIDSVLVNLNYATPDPMVLATALAVATDRLKFMVAHRPGLMLPTFFVKQVNTFSALAAGRITLNLVAGYSPDEQRYYGDDLAHNERYQR